MTYVYRVLKDKPIGMWPLGSIVSSKAADVSGYKRDATLTGTLIQTQPCVAGGISGLQFDSTDLLAYPVPDIMTSGSAIKPFTLEAWIRPDNVSGNSYILSRSASGGSGLILDGVTLRMTTVLDVEYSAKWSGVEAGNVYHVVGIYDTQSVGLYVNGEMVASTDILQNGADFPLTMAANPNLRSQTSNGAKFTLDSAAAYGYVLNGDTVKAHYDYGTSQPDVDQISGFSGANTFRFSDANAQVNDTFNLTTDDGFNTGLINGAVSVIDDSVMNMFNYDTSTYQAGTWQTSFSKFVSRNLAIGGSYGLSGTTAGQTLTAGVAYNDDIWTRWTQNTTTTTGQMRYMYLLANLVNGQTYTASFQVANDGVNPVTFSLDFCDTPSASYTLQPGDQQRVWVTGTKTTYDNVFRFTDISGLEAAQSILINDPMLELGDTMGEYVNVSEVTDEPIAQPNATITGSRLTWDANVNNLLVETSTDGGTTWSPIGNGGQPLATGNLDLGVEIAVRITFPEAATQTVLTGLKVVLYDNKDCHGTNDDLIADIIGTNGATLSEFDFNPAAFNTNTGVVLTGAGTGVIIPTDAEFGGYQTIEMSVYIPSTIVSKTLLSCGTSTITTGTTGTLTLTNITALYVDGVLQTTAALTPGMAHHIVVVVPANTSPVYIGTNTAGTIGVPMTLGYVATYPIALTAPGATALYKAWVGAPAATIRDASHINIKEHIYTDTNLAFRGYAYDWSISAGD